tara:strand:+ start:12942 stop:13583 length:642 start_codon:yes stop_codon:yes gene_type:complete
VKKKPLIGIVDTETSNIKSVFYALSSLNVDIAYITSKENAPKVDAIVVPGIGNFGFVMRKLKERKLDEFIIEKISKNLPGLFICVGMQILFSKSEELGMHEGLSLLEGKIRKIDIYNNKGKKVRNVPMIGWSQIVKIKDCNLLKGSNQNSFFYFTHSFFADPKDKKIISSKNNYLGFEYCASISKNNIFATQFHPEKSGETGIKLYENFIKEI